MLNCESLRVEIQRIDVREDSNKLFNRPGHPLRMKVSKPYGYPSRIRTLVTGDWAGEVDLWDLTISAWAAEHDGERISNLPDVSRPPAEGFNVSTEESVAYVKRKGEWNRPHDALLQIAKNHNRDLIPIIAPQS